MRVARLKHCCDAAGLESLVEAFAARGLTASPSRLSRWEYGQSNATNRLLRAYEEGAGLNPYLLFALNDRQRRADVGAFAAVPSVDMAEGLTADDIYEVLDRAVSNAKVSGSEWYVLAGYTSCNGYFYLTPHNTRLLAHRLIGELARSIGAAYILRFEALHLFAGMDRVREAFVDELIDMIVDESAGTIGDGASLILRATPRERAKLATLLRGSHAQVAGQNTLRIKEILMDHTPLDEPALDRKVVVAHAVALCRALPRWTMAHVETDLTQRLIEAAIGGRFRSRRHEASLLLMLADIPPQTGAVLLDLYEQATDPLLRRRLANLNQYLIRAANPDRLESLALAETDPETRRALWAARGYVRKPIEVSEPIRHALADPVARHAVSHALGTSGSIADGLLADKRFDKSLKDTFQWWHSRGPALLA